MIWSVTEDPQSIQDALQKFVVAEIASVCPDLEISKDHISELAKAVTTYCAEQGCVRQIHSDFLALLLSRALRGIGQTQAARRIEESRLSDQTQADVFDAAWPGAITADTWSLYASRLMRPSRWFSGDGKVTWVLDFSRLTQSEDVFIELALLPALRSLLEKMAEVWDASGGKGTLGLRGLPSFFSVLGRKKAIKSQMAFLPSYCEEVLARIRQARGWQSAPRVIKLDLPVRGG